MLICNFLTTKRLLLDMFFGNSRISTGGKIADIFIFRIFRADLTGLLE